MGIAMAEDIQKVHSIFYYIMYNGEKVKLMDKL